jgi:hypothetical protein
MDINRFTESMQMAVVYSYLADNSNHPKTG